jgi:hypothetical protein
MSVVVAVSRGVESVRHLRGGLALIISVLAVFCSDRRKSVFASAT